MTGKNIVWLKKIKNDFLKKYIKNKNILNQPGLIHQTHGPGHKLDWHSSQWHSSRQIEHFDTKFVHFFQQNLTGQYLLFFCCFFDNSLLFLKLFRNKM
jgi:hypothetical protein